MLQAIGQVTDARTVLESTQEKHPQDVRFAVTLALIGDRADDAAYVEGQLNDIEDQFGLQPIIWDKRLALLLRQRGPETAAKLEAIAARLPDLSDNDRFSRHLKLGSAWEVTRLLQLVQSGKLEYLQQARALIHEIELRRPGWHMLLLHEASLAEIEQRPDKAIEKYFSAVDLGKAGPAAVERLVMLLYQSERIEEAAGVLQTAENRTPSSMFDASALLGWSTILALRDEDSQRVLQLAERRVAAYPGDYRSHTWLGQVLAGEKRFDEAELEFQTAIDLDGDAELPWVNLTALLVQQEKRDAARAVFDQLRRGKSPSPAAVAKCADALGDPDAAAHYEAALVAAPGDMQLRQQVIMFYMRTGHQGRYTESVGLYEKALGLNGANVQALNNLAWLYAVGGGDPALARQLVQRVIDLTGRNPVLLETMTTVLVANKEYDQALKVLQEAIEDERTPTRLFYLAQLHSKSGDIPLARTALAEARAAGLTVETLHPIEQQQYRELSETLSPDPAAK